MKRILIFTLLLSLIFGGSIIIDNHNAKIYGDDLDLSAVKIDDVLQSNITYIEGYDESSSYYGVYTNWMKVQETLPSEVYTITAGDITGGEVVLGQNSNDYGKAVVKVIPQETIEFDVTTSSEGLYEIYIDYYLLEETLLRPTISLTINDELQYNEMANLDVPTNWLVESEPVFDRFGDELTRNSSLENAWSSFAISDPNYYFMEPLKVYLPEGVSTISIITNEGFILYGDITIGNLYEAPSAYSEYLNEQPISNTAVSTIEIAAENYNIESRQNIRSKFMRDPSLTPYSYKNRVLNVLDQTSYRKSGDSISYFFTVEEDGYYNLSLKYLQSENDELASKRAIFIDNEIPFEELSSYAFDYSRSWETITLGDDDTAYKIYLEAGEHSLELKVMNHEIRDVYHRLLDVLTHIDDLSREINKITGGLTDKDRDYKLATYMPTLIDELKEIKSEIGIAKEEFIQVYDTDDLSIINELDLSMAYLDDFIEEPDDIPPYKSRFNEGESSVYGRINIILPRLIDSPLQLDAIYFHGEDADLPRTSANIFVKIWEGIRAFSYSFFDPKYNESAQVDDETVEIWVRNSRLYIQVMQRMIDESFTPETGIKIQLSVMPDENKIVLANAANTTPDAAMGLTVTRPFEFAIRGMVEDLSKMEGFYDLTSEFNMNSFIPYVYEEGVYSLPETMDVKLLFYRTDILEYLNVEPPQTWEEVVSLIPVMQKFNYTFYTPLGGDNAFKTFGETTPFIYQHSGILYNETGDKVLLNEGGAYDAFEFMTDLFSVYNIPITTSNFFQKFRDGQTPIGIGDANTYIQLKYAAPELAGQWKVIPIPGVEYEDKDETTCPGPLTDGRCIERWDPTYGSSSVIFKDTDKQDLAWEYFQWWFSSQVQSDFTYQLQSLLGDEFLHMTANVEAFKTSAWPSDSKYEILEQWEWVRTTGKVPGDYLVERELSNAWNTVVNDGTNPRVAIDDAVIIINRELKRKLTEFGYYKDGVRVKTYLIPTADNIFLWMIEGSVE